MATSLWNELAVAVLKENNAHKCLNKQWLKHKHELNFKTNFIKHRKLRNPWRGLQLMDTGSARRIHKLLPDRLVVLTNLENGYNIQREQSNPGEKTFRNLHITVAIFGSRHEIPYEAAKCPIVPSWISLHMRIVLTGKQRALWPAHEEVKYVRWRTCA